MVSVSPHYDVSSGRQETFLFRAPSHSRCSGNVCGVNLSLLIGSKFCPRISELGVPLEVSGSTLLFCRWGTEAQRRAQMAQGSRACRLPLPRVLAGSPPPQGPGRCVCLSLSFWPDGRSPLAGTSPHKEPSRAWGSEVPFPAPQLVPGSSVAHPRSTRRSCLPLGARRPPHGPPSCPLRGLALPGIPLGRHSRGENKPGAVGGVQRS